MHSKAGMVGRLGAGEGSGAVGDVLEHGERPLVVGGDCTILIGVLDTLRENVGRAPFHGSYARRLVKLLSDVLES